MLLGINVLIFLILANAVVILFATWKVTSRQAESVIASGHVLWIKIDNLVS